MVVNPRLHNLLASLALALHDDGRPRPFQETMSRFGAAAGELLLQPFFFDCLHLDGTDLLDAPLAQRLDALDTALATMLTALDRGTTPNTDAVRDALNATEQANGDVKVSHATVVTDAAILVFREGLEAVLILAAITASFVGARKHLRRPVLLGGLAGIGATAITWAIVQLLIEQLGTGGMVASETRLKTKTRSLVESDRVQCATCWERHERQC